MSDRILFIGGKQDGQYNRISERLNEIKLKVYPKLDLSKLAGIIKELPQPLRTEIYHRKKVDDVEYFVLESIGDDEIQARISSLK